MGSETLKSLPLLPLKNSVLFPQLLVPLSVGRPTSLAAVEKALTSEDAEILVVAQKDPSLDEPEGASLHSMATRAIIRKVTRPETALVEVIVQGQERVQLSNIRKTDTHLEADYSQASWVEEEGPEIEALFRSVLDNASRVFSLSRSQTSQEIAQLVAKTEDRTRVVYLLTSMLHLEIPKEQALLEAMTLGKALNLLLEYLRYEAQVLELRREISSNAQSELNEEQRKYLLRQQIRQIQEELGEQDAEVAEVDQLRLDLDKADLPESVREEAERELNRLSRLPAAAPEYHTIRTYVGLILELPWKRSSESSFDLKDAKRILDEDHYDLEEVKDRILDQLGVHKLNPGARSPIICFVGPPGVGKTSLGQSIARALNRPFERLALGGLHDEAELRGHRRTYVGAMPGRILQAIRRAGTNDPVLMLDEIDKLGRDFRGDPAAALLEILDPAQNHTFHDNYLDLPFDLSKVLFITTANTLASIPGPLLDRLEVLRLAGYTEEEKIEIAKRYLIPRQLKEVGLEHGDCRIEDQTLRRLATRYTREAGVRQLERTIGRLARKVARRFAEGSTDPVVIQPADLQEMLGAELFLLEEARRDLPPGVATGLAWTETGGEVLFVEATLLPEGKGLTMTGQLGDVMQESAKAAQSYIWSHAAELNVDPKLFKNSGIHIHVPAGAIPKDGPSAGVTMITALTSLYTGRPVLQDTAMTGEITLSGLVLPIGGVKEKVLAAQRAGVNRVILPEQNRKDLTKLPDSVRETMNFVFVKNVDQLLDSTLPRSQGPEVHARVS